MLSSTVFTNVIFLGSGAFIIKWLCDDLFNPIKNLWYGIEFDYKLIKVKKTNYGWYVLIDANGGSYENFITYKGTIEKIYGVRAYIKDIKYSNNIEMELVGKDFDLVYKHLSLSAYELLIGYDYKGKPIICDMRVTPHLGIVGISNNGKSKCVELMLKNLRGADITLINAMDKDYKGIRCKRINEENDIIDFLYYTTHGDVIYSKPQYIVVDEYNALNNLDGLDDAIEGLLRQARHRNIFVIVIGQQMDKESCNFKNLFNCRLCFKQVSPLSYYSFLGNTVDDVNLRQREFILQSTDLIYGKTFKIVK